MSDPDVRQHLTPPEHLDLMRERLGPVRRPRSWNGTAVDDQQSRERALELVRAFDPTWLERVEQAKAAEAAESDG